MNELFQYLLESGISLALFYAVYWIFLKKETFFSVNRFYLIFSVVFSLLIPFLRIPSPFFVTHIANSSQSLGQMSPPIQSTQSAGFTHYFWLIYLLGAGILFIRFAFQLLQLFYLVKKYGVEKVKGLHFVFTKRRFSDFTFFKLIFIDKSKLTEDDLDQIIAHEQIHIKQYHTLDLIFVELLTIFQWFNPFVWLYKSSIKETHEYLADDAVIAQGCNTAKYQLLIFERFVGVRLFDLASNFHQSQIKRRITMMTKHKSKGRAKYKVLLILPVLSFLVLAFAEPRVLTQEKQEKKAVTQVQKVEPVKIKKQANGVATLGEHEVVEPKSVEVKVDPEIVLAEPDKIVLRQPVIVSHQDLAKVKKEQEFQEKEKKLREEKIKILKKEYEVLKKEIEAGGDGEEIKKKKALLEKKMMALKKEEEFIKMKKMEGDGRLYELELAAKFKSERKKLKEMVAKAETEEEKEALMEKMRKLDEKEKEVKKELGKKREMEKKKKESNEEATLEKKKVKAESGEDGDGNLKKSMERIDELKLIYSRLKEEYEKLRISEKKSSYGLALEMEKIKEAMAEAETDEQKNKLATQLRVLKEKTEKAKQEFTKKQEIQVKKLKKVAAELDEQEKVLALEIKKAMEKEKEEKEKSTKKEVIKM